MYTVGMENCIFCQIVSGEIGATKVYEDAETLAFLDIAPNNHGHTLVIPKDHFENIYSLPGETAARMMLCAQKISIAIKNALSCDGITITINNEAAGGQEVFHSHIHVIPRTKDDFSIRFPHKTYLPGEAEDVANKIREEI